MPPDHHLHVSLFNETGAKQSPPVGAAYHQPSQPRRWKVSPQPQALTRFGSVRSVSSTCWGVPATSGPAPYLEQYC